MAKLGNIRTAWRKTVVLVAFVAMMTIGYLSISAVTSCPAEAQACSCGACVALTPGVGPSFIAVSKQAALQISAATNIIVAQYTLAAEAFALQAVTRFGQIVTDIDDWYDTYWYYNERPAMQAAVEQDNVQEAMQTATLSMFRDAAEQARTIRTLAEIEVESAARNQPSAQICTAGTMSGGLMRANAIRRAYAAAAPVQAARRTANTRGTAAAQGAAADIAERWNNVRATYCNSEDNNGNSGCAVDGPMVDADIDVTATIFMNDTIDLTDPQVRQAVDDLITNVAEPFAPNLIPASAANGAAGVEASVRRDAYRAQRQAIHAALQHVVARRAPGAGNGSFLAAMRESAGMSADMLTNNPSHNEILEVMASERFRTGQYSLEQVDTPDNNARELVVQNATEVMLNKDRNDLIDLLSLMVAVESAIESKATRARGGGQ